MGSGEYMYAWIPRITPEKWLKLNQRSDEYPWKEFHQCFSVFAENVIDLFANNYLHIYRF